MASTEVTGATRQEIEELRERYLNKHDSDPPVPFEHTRCLVRIPKQPEDYTGPVRYCTLQRDLHDLGSKVICKYHGGAGQPTIENLDKLAHMKHGMDATREHLIEDFDEKDQALYDWIIDAWPEAYDISIEDDPQAAYDFHRLAAEVVRAERGRGWLAQEGEVQEEPVRNEEGRIVTDEHGDVVTEKSEHYLAKMMHRQDKKLSDIEKELGITRKERLRQDTADDAVETMKSFADLGAAFLNRDSKEYDPDNKPWEEDSNESDS